MAAMSVWDLLRQSLGNVCVSRLPEAIHIGSTIPNVKHLCG